MDSNRIEGAATTLGGKVKDVLGGLLGDTRTQAEGKADQFAGRAQYAYGSAKDGVQDTVDELGSQLGGFVRERPVVALISALGIGYVLSRLLSRR